MGEFSADWLRLRAPADARARAAALPLLLRQHRSSQEPLRVIDLGCGTGSNLRILAPILGGVQAWRCLDADQGLLDQIGPETEVWSAEAGCRWDASDRFITRSQPYFACSIETCRFDLAQSLGDLPMDGIGLMTASALLDLVSDDWLTALVARCAQACTPMLFVLTYEGRVHFEPEVRLDREVIEFVNAHQRRDKGFGPALGPAANARLATLAASHGYRVEVRTSDWRIARSERALQAALIRGWCEAACEQAPSRAGALRHWQAMRLAAVDQGISRIRVGHGDLLAIPRPGDVMPRRCVEG
jgi:SAM-dependent methyltransferase